MTTNLACAAVLGTVAALSGWFLVHHRPARPSGTFLLGGGASVVLGVAAWLVGLEQVAGSWFWLAGGTLLPLSFLTYPVARWRNPLSFVLLVTAGGAGLLSVLWPTSFQVTGYLLGSCLVVHVWWGFEQGDAVERRALAWSALAWGGGALTLLFVAFLAEAAGGPGTDWRVGAVGIAAAVPAPAAMVVGALRPELVDVRGLVTRAVVAATVLAVYLAVADAVVATIEAVTGRPQPSTPTIVLCGVLAFGVRPLQVVLRGVVDRLLFGDRPDPLEAATVLADRIGDDPVRALDAVREALVLPYASLRVGGTVLATSGVEVTHTRAVPLRLGGDGLGELVVGLRAGDLGLSSADTDVLRLVAPLLAQTLRAQAMTRDLQLSREAVVAAVEEERRRLRRDLHDSLGPTLTGVAFASDAARNQLRSDPERAAELLRTLRADTADAITEIRRLVEGLRPPALDQIGFVGSIRQYAETLHSADGTRLEVAVVAEAGLPALSAATEVAAYRIVVEALTNTARHAGARRADVVIATRDDRLVLEIRDDGRDPTAWEPGVGLTAMRERSEQVGGTLRASSSATGGLVEASIPLGPARVRTAPTPGAPGNVHRSGLGPSPGAP